MGVHRTIQGLQRSVFLWRLKLQVLAHFAPLLLEGTLTPRRFLLFLRRLLLFLSKLEHNKFVRIGRTTRLDLYVPAFPTPPFYFGCRKFLCFDGPLPCVTALISVTSACRFRCPHCYQRRDRGHDVKLDVLLTVVERLQQMGVAFFNIEGGEPFLVYDRLKAVCSAIDSRSEIWINSTGDGMTLDRLRELKRLNLTAVMFSLHHPDPEQTNAFMQSDGAWDFLTNGVRLCHEAGVLVSFNSCLLPAAFHDGSFERLMNCAKEFGACLIQLIKPKPAGAWLHQESLTFTPRDMQRMTELVFRYNHDPAFAKYPAICAQALEEDQTRFGCTAGGTDRFYINAKGDVQPCEFLNISFGNIAEENFDSIYARMRSAFCPPAETWLCEACSPKIRELLHTQVPPNLPLNPELSKEVCRNWNRGRPTKLYEDLASLR